MSDKNTSVEGFCTECQKKWKTNKAMVDFLAEKGETCYTCWDMRRRKFILENLSSFTPKELAKMIKSNHISLREIETGIVEGAWNVIKNSS
jgi:hypothetical protein